MEINGVLFNSTLEQILEELSTQLKMNNIPYLNKMKRTGRSIQVCCPYHKEGQERKPSAGIRESDGKFHCFTCGEIHELPEVISFCFGYQDDILGKHGWNWLLKNFATMEKEERQTPKLDFSRDRNLTNIEKNYITETELDSYRYYHPYWRKRKITDEWLIELFDLGYDKDTGCITFPVRDITGNCLFVARRSVKFKYFNYPKGTEKPLYGIYELKQLETFPMEIIVCESMIDALTCWQYGKYAVALNGLGNERQFRELRDLPCRKLILATDADTAGMEARNRIRLNVTNKIITQYVWDKEQAKDINEMDKEMFLNLKEVF